MLRYVELPLTDHLTIKDKWSHLTNGESCFLLRQADYQGLLLVAPPCGDKSKTKKLYGPSGVSDGYFEE